MWGIIWMGFRVLQGPPCDLTVLGIDLFKLWRKLPCMHLLDLPSYLDHFQHFRAVESIHAHLTQRLTCKSILKQYLIARSSNLIITSLSSSPSSSTPLWLNNFSPTSEAHFGIELGSFPSFQIHPGPCTQPRDPSSQSIGISNLPRDR